MKCEVQRDHFALCEPQCKWGITRPRKPGVSILPNLNSFFSSAGPLLPMWKTTPTFDIDIMRIFLPFYFDLMSRLRQMARSLIWAHLDTCKLLTISWEPKIMTTMLNDKKQRHWTDLAILVMFVSKMLLVCRGTKVSGWEFELLWSSLLISITTAWWPFIVRQRKLQRSAIWISASHSVHLGKASGKVTILGLSIWIFF